jgi:hypothetical protein
MTGGGDREVDDVFDDLASRDDGERSVLDVTRSEYTGVVDIEDLPLDEVELEEAGLALDDPDRIALLSGGMDDPDGADIHEGHHVDPDEVGWDLDPEATD